MGNRVEDLETQVAQLQAAVDGLTEELVETKERLRQLETATESEPSAETEGTHAELVPNESATDADGGEAGTGVEDGSEVEEGSDEDNSAETEDGSDDGDDAEESDDIIVA